MTSTNRSSTARFTPYNKLIEHAGDVEDVDAPEIELIGEDPPAQYGSFVGFCIALNFVMGTSGFTLPFGFAKAGLCLSSLLLIIGAILTAITVVYTLEFMARVQTIHDREQDETRLIHKVQESDKEEPLEYTLEGESFTYTKAAEVVQGKYGRLLMQSYVVVYMACSLWGYAAVFGSSAARIVAQYIQGVQCNPFASDVSEQCESNFFITLSAFTVATVIMTLFEIGEQAIVQMLLTIYKFLATFLMFTILLLKIFFQDTQTAQRVANVGAFTFTELALVFAPAVSSLNFCSNIPDIVHPLRNKNKAKLVTLSALAFVCLLYLSIGLLGSIAFDDVNELITLNFESFTGCGPSGWDKCSNGKSKTIIASIVQLIIYMYPPMNALATYPLLATTLGNNLAYSKPAFITKNLSPKQQSRFYRFISGLIPIVLAFKFKNVNTISVFAGFVGFFLSFVGPASVQISSIYYSKRKSQEFGFLPSWKTQFSSFYSGLEASYAVGILGFGLFVMAVVTYIT